MGNHTEIKPSRWEGRTDQWVAILGSAIPVAIVLGVVVFEFFISLAGLAWLVSRFKFPIRSRIRITRNLLFWPLFSWLVVVMLSRVINGGSAFQFAHDFAFLRYPLFVVAMLDVSQRIPVQRYLLGGLLAGIVYAALNLLSAHLTGHDFIGKPLTRYVTKMYEASRISGLSAYAVPFLLLWGMFDRSLDRPKRIGIIVSGFIGVFMLISFQGRTAILAALIGLLGGVLSQLKIRKHLKIGGVLAAFLLVGMGAWGVMWMYPSFESMYDRIYIWQVSLQVWLQHPVAGVGITSFNDAYRQIAESGIIAPAVSPAGNVYHSINPRHAHNLFLQLMACNGVLGLGAFGWIFWRVAKILRGYCNSWHIGLMGWPFICLTIGLTGWNIYDPFYAAVIFYFLALITISASAAPGNQFA